MKTLGMPCITAWLCMSFYCTTARAITSSEQPLGDCGADMVRDLFEGSKVRTQFRALVTRFSGSDSAAKHFGMKVGESLRDALTKYSQHTLDMTNTGLTSANVRVKYVPCVIGDHEHARKVGQAAGADVVLWGQTFCDWRKPNKCQKVELGLNLSNAQINSGNTIQNSPGATMSNHIQIKLPPVQAPPTPPSETAFRTSLTVVNYIGLEAAASNAISVNRISELIQSELPTLTAEQPKLLLDYLLGLYAFRADRYALAAALFLRSQQSISAGVKGAHELYRMMGWSYISVGEREAGAQALRQALQACEPGDDECRTEELCSAAFAERLYGRVGEAIMLLHESLRLAQKLGNQRSEAEALHELGFIYEDIKEHKKALVFYDHSLRLRVKISDRVGEAAILNNIGAIFYLEGDKTKALESYEQAFSIQKKIGDKCGVASILINIANIYRELHEYQKASDAYRDALACKKVQGDYQGEGFALKGLANVYSDIKNVNQALLFNQQALNLFQKTGDVIAIVGTIHDMALVLRDLNRPAEAIARFQEAAGIHLRQGHLGLVDIWKNLKLACETALQHRLTDQAEALVKQLELNNYPSNDLAVLRAQIFNQSH